MFALFITLFVQQLIVFDVDVVIDIVIRVGGNGVINKRYKLANAINILIIY